jgi:uncharacterized OsmC-like protein
MIMTQTDTAPRLTNGLDLGALNDVVESINRDASNALIAFHVTTDWKGQTRSQSSVESYVGTNTAPNPQELLMSAVNACMLVGYVAQASVRGITLESCRIETDGELDLRGFLGLADDVPPGYRQINYAVHIKGDGTPEQYREIHQAVMQTSPNYFNMARPIRMNGVLQLD